MRRRHSLGLATLFLIIQPGAVFANQPPGPLFVLPEISILMVMMLLTALGGGYVVLNQHNPGRRGLLRVLGAVLLILWSLVHQGAAFLVCIIFGIIAVFRGLNMLFWGSTAGVEEKVSDYFQDVSPRRLLFAGSLLVIVSLFLVGMALAFVLYYPMPAHKIEASLESFIAHEIARGRIEEQRTGDLRFRPVKNASTDFSRTRLNEMEIQIEYGKDNKNFIIYVPPRATFGRGNSRFPFFPYNYLVSHPSYRGDETGQVRMIYTHHETEKCPASAPVVKTVSETEIEKAMADLRKRDVSS